MASCVNCGRPAAWRTTNPGAEAVDYCEACGLGAYPDPAGKLRRLEGEAPQEEEQVRGGEEIQLRGGQTALDRRLDRLPEFDERSRNFPMAEILAEVPAKAYKPRSYTWKCDYHWDQGPEGACVGFAWAHELIARPVVIEGIDYGMSRWIYKTAQKYDYWAGEAYQGTSVIAGAKVLQKRPPAMPEGRGLMEEYRWIFGDLDELIKTVGYFGPVVLGANWYAGMMKTDGEGFIRRSGSLLGGHAILIKGQSLQKKAFRLHNSWGTDWGEGGDCWLSFSDLERLLGERGELCVPVHRLEWG